MTYRQYLAFQVLECAKDAGDEFVIAACRRVLNAARIGWRKHGNAADWRVVLAFAAD